MSKRANQIEQPCPVRGRWREQHPGQEPDAAVLRRWDQQAWAFERPRRCKRRRAPRASGSLSCATPACKSMASSPVELPASTNLDQLDRAAIAEHVVIVAGLDRRHGHWPT